MSAHTATTKQVERRRPESRSDTELFQQLRGLAEDEACREEIATALVHRYSWMVHWAANRYSRRGELTEELEQVGYLGLVEAIDRFDPDRGVQFASFARPTILGELRRHFRDHRRWIRLPRKIQELKLRLNEATEYLTHATGRTPTPAELAVYLDASVEDLTEALATDDGFTPLSLDHPLGSDDGASYLDSLATDGDLSDVVDHASLWPLIQQLPAREQHMLLLRFYGNKSQSEIADQLGVSQMHISRLLHQTLTTLRSQLTGSPS